MAQAERRLSGVLVRRCAISNDGTEQTGSVTPHVEPAPQSVPTSTERELPSVDSAAQDSNPPPLQPLDLEPIGSNRFVESAEDALQIEGFINWEPEDPKKRTSSDLHPILTNH